MTKLILSQSANGRAIDATDLISGNNNYIPIPFLNTFNMKVLIHKPEDEFVPERVELFLSNPGKKRITVAVEFDTEWVEIEIDRESTVTYFQTIQRWDPNGVLAIYKTQGDTLFVTGAAEK